jgi:hypothetical protein
MGGDSKLEIAEDSKFETRNSSKFIHPHLKPLVLSSLSITQLA